MKILLTGGAGYIGSHTYVAMASAGIEPVILDDFSNSNAEVLRRLGVVASTEVACERGDVCDSNFVRFVLKRHAIEGVVHFAAHKSIGESVADPVKYFRNNVGGLISLLDGLNESGVRTIVYSSSASVYGVPERCPVTEDFALKPTNPYAKSKLIGEEILGAMSEVSPEWRIGVLRYFNPIGAHPGGSIGEDSRSKELGNLMPAILEVALGHRRHLRCYGNDYPTRDGTGVRDYIHVMDLAEGHVRMLRSLGETRRMITVNLGTGRGYSVLEIVRAFERASGRPIPIEFESRRRGDVAECWADPSMAKRLLGWEAVRTLDEMCLDAWNWQCRNPGGFSGGNG